MDGSVDRSNQNLNITAASDRFDRSPGRSIESIDSIDSIIFEFLGSPGVKRNVGELEICVLSKFQLCTTLGGRKHTRKPKRKKLDFFVKFDSIDSIIVSIRSIIRSVAVWQIRSVIRVITLITLLCCFDEEGHSLCSKKDIPYVRRRTFFVFEARHFLCSKRDIPCVRSKTFLVFEAGHSLCCEEDILCVPITNKAHATFW